MAVDGSETENNINLESKLTFNLESNDTNDNKTINTNNESENRATNCISDKSEIVNYQSHSDGKVLAYDVNSNINNRNVSIIYNPDNKNSLELTPTNIDKLTHTDFELDKPENLTDLENQRNPEVFKTYKTRFWVLALFCYSFFMMLLIWGTFSPILESAEWAYGWSDSYFALLEGWGSIFSLITMIPFGVAVHKYGEFEICNAFDMRLYYSSYWYSMRNNKRHSIYILSLVLSCIINGMTSCVVLSLPPLISVVWFPANERATATAISETAMLLGIAGMYLSPLIVRAPENGVPSQEDVRSDMQTLMFICKKYDVMCIIMIYTFSTSIPFCWLSIINLSMECLGISQDESMWIAVAASLIAMMMTILVGRVTDYFRGYMKVSIASLLLGSSACFFWFLLITEKVLTVSIAQVYISVILGIGLQYSAVPLMMELAVELAYPAPENAVGTMFSAMLELCDVAFLLLMMIPTDCYVWISYAVVASTSLTVIPLIFVKEVYHRSAVDDENEQRVGTNGVTSGINGVTSGTNGVTSGINGVTSGTLTE
ncbi:Disrupted in renal carcinoma protein 2-like protein [Armadillidium nasatum]|uniref:Disrupted in renal carcinoma protein 2-like protein n=1 Tax=Armadillidium nasatum TaxID=96803 RepID=A0A5N5SK56_9CRUS|nr:Disrupted in renal carcinoma protein 2-like protein [Armadillidium nasatum]